jgi:hypothetical protein
MTGSTEATEQFTVSVLLANLIQESRNKRSQ